MNEIRKICTYLPYVKSKYYVSDTGTVYVKVVGIGHNGSVRATLDGERVPITSAYKRTLKKIREQDLNYALVPDTGRGYVVLPDGTLLRRLHGRRHKSCSQGRYMYSIRRTDDTEWETQAARLVAACFIGPIEGKDVHHIDGDAHNDAVSNLQIVSRSDHMSIENTLRGSTTKGSDQAKGSRSTEHAPVA